jgi:hypothetical protein
MKQDQVWQVLQWEQRCLLKELLLQQWVLMLWAQQWEWKVWATELWVKPWAEL